MDKTGGEVPRTAEPSRWERIKDMFHMMLEDDVAPLDQVHAELDAEDLASQESD